MSAKSELRSKTKLARRFLQDFPTRRDGDAERSQEMCIRAVRQLAYLYVAVRIGTATNPSTENKASARERV